jgi:hypothetical protein
MVRAPPSLATGAASTAPSSLGGPATEGMGGPTILAGSGAGARRRAELGRGPVDDLSIDRPRPPRITREECAVADRVDQNGGASRE